MSQSASDGCNDSAQHPNQQQQQQTSSDSKINASEIEKLYLKIKEDWLWDFKKFSIFSKLILKILIKRNILLFYNFHPKFTKQLPLLKKINIFFRAKLPVRPILL